MFKSKVIVCSDRAKSGMYEDKTGPKVLEWLSEHNYLISPAYATIIPDDQLALIEVLEHSKQFDLIIICGGSGLGSRDICPQTLNQYCDYEIPGIGEVLRRESLKSTAKAIQSRVGGWVWQRQLLVLTPGSPKASAENLEFLEPYLEICLKGLHNSCTH